MSDKPELVFQEVIPPVSKQQDKSLARYQQLLEKAGSALGFDINLRKDSTSGSSSFHEVDMDAIWTTKQPRKDLGDIDALAESIKQRGLLQPVVLLPQKNPEDPEKQYLLVAGERRFRACQKLGFKKIKAIFLDPNNTDKNDLLMLQLIENLQRKSLTPSETAKGLLEIFRQMEPDLSPQKCETYCKYFQNPSRKKKHRELKPFLETLRVLNITPKQAVCYFRLLRFPDWVQEAVNRGEIPITRLEKALSLLDDEDALRKFFSPRRSSKGVSNLDTLHRQLQRIESQVKKINLTGLPDPKHQQVKTKIEQLSSLVKEIMDLLKE